MARGEQLPPFPAVEDGGPVGDIDRTIVWPGIGPPPSDPRRAAWLRWRRAVEQASEPEDELPPAA